MARLIKGVAIAAPLSNIQLIERILWAGFGQNRVDFQPQDDGTYYIYIYFPEITITNDKGRSHVMKELYVRLHIKNDGKWVKPNFYIFRTRFTAMEYESIYLFSHGTSAGILISSSSTPFNSLYKCCCGGYITQSMISLTEKLFDELNWQLFLNNLVIYLSYEDLDGGPYRKMADIQYNSNNSNYYFSVYNNRSGWISQLKEHLYNLSRYKSIPSFYIIHNDILPNLVKEVLPYIKYSIVSDMKDISIVVTNSILEIEELITTYLYKTSTLELLVNKSTENEYFIPTDPSGISRHGMVIPLNIKFKNKELKIVIEEDNTPLPTEIGNTKVPLPALSIAVANIIQNLLKIHMLNIPYFNLNDGN